MPVSEAKFPRSGGSMADVDGWTYSHGCGFSSNIYRKRTTALLIQREHEKQCPVK